MRLKSIDMVEIELSNTAKSPIEKKLLEKIAGETIARSGILDLRKKNISISFANVSEKEMQRLNRTYRKKNTPTDVLTFAEFENKKEIKRELQGADAPMGRLYGRGNKNPDALFLGEIVLCYNNIAEYSKRNRLDLEWEFWEVAAHGVLHLLGFRHGKKMFEIQNHEE